MKKKKNNVIESILDLISESRDIILVFIKREHCDIFSDPRIVESLKLKAEKLILKITVEPSELFEEIDSKLSTAFENHLLPMNEKTAKASLLTKTGILLSVVVEKEGSFILKEERTAPSK